jgi:hypothetical protein
MNKIAAIQISMILVVSGALGGMLVVTDIYDDVYSKIVSTLCLSCIKLDTNLPKDFTFKTADGQDHPEFIEDTLKTKGPILIQYGEKACAACDDMINFVIKPYFNLSFDKTSSYETEVNIDNLSFIYIYVYIDDDSTPQDRIDSFDIYDKEHFDAFPMFTIITIEYDHGGDIKPYYSTLYGKFEKDNNYEKMAQTFTELLELSQELYDRNIAGYI